MRTIVRFAAVVAAGFAMHLSTAQATSERVVYSFCSQANCADGDAPAASLIDMNGILYGTTQGGGTARDGTVFSIDPNTGVETVLHSFTSKPDGVGPVAPLVNVRGVLYGTTSGGGAEYLGTVFSIDPNTGVETVLHSFGGTKDGTYPKAGLIAVNDKLYGTTEEGGTGACRSPGCGTVFAINLKTGRETVVYSFCSQTNCTDGADPDAPLLNVGGTLYGTTLSGGTNPCYGYPCGTVFSLDAATDVETALYSFQSPPDAANPVAGLANLQGTLYGTTYAGGTYNRGAVFSINPTTGQETVQYSFENGGPYAGLTRVGGTLYGATPSLVFAFKPATGSFKPVHRFCRSCGDGSDALASVIAVNGTLYGTTVEGGTSTTCHRGCGTVFAVQLP